MYVGWAFQPPCHDCVYCWHSEGVSYVRRLGFQPPGHTDNRVRGVPIRSFWGFPAAGPYLYILIAERKGDLRM